MVEFVDRLTGLAVEAASPDGLIRCCVQGPGDRIEVAFRTGSYGRYTEGTLAAQLGRLATVAFTRYRRAEQEIIDGEFGVAGHDGPVELSPEQRRYNAGLEQVAAGGASPGDQIAVRTRALVSWDVAITRGVLRRWSEAEFLADLSVAVSRLLAEYRMKVFALKDEVYDLGYPSSLRQRVGLGVRAHRSGWSR